MEVALIEKIINHGYEVWITDRIDIGEGMGDIFDNHHEAILYAGEHDIPVIDLCHEPRVFLQGEELRSHLRKYLDIGQNGVIISIK